MMDTTITNIHRVARMRLKDIELTPEGGRGDKDNNLLLYRQITRLDTVIILQLNKDKTPTLLPKSARSRRESEFLQAIQCDDDISHYGSLTFCHSIILKLLLQGAQTDA